MKIINPLSQGPPWIAWSLPIGTVWPAKSSISRSTMYRILICRFISSHHNKLFHFLWPVLWKPGKSPWYWGRQRQKGGDLATVCGVSAENQPRTRCESRSRYISQNIGRVVQFDTFNVIQVLFNFFLAQRTLELFFNLIQFFCSRTHT